MKKEHTLPHGCRVSHRGPHLSNLYKKQVHRAVRRTEKAIIEEQLESEADPFAYLNFDWADADLVTDWLDTSMEADIRADFNQAEIYDDWFDDDYFDWPGGE